MKKIRRIICLVLYYGIAQYLPDSYFGVKFIAHFSNWFRIILCKGIFKKCGHVRTINRGVYFGTGSQVEIGDESGIGARTSIPNNTIIGNHVMLSRDCLILWANHKFDRTDIPINDQGMHPWAQTVIEDDCWIGLRTLMTPGRHVKKGTIVAMGSVLTKDYPEYSVVGGNPAKVIKSRLSGSNDNENSNSN